MDSAGGGSSSSSRQQQQKQQRNSCSSSSSQKQSARRPQHYHYEEHVVAPPPGVIRQTPPSAHHYRGSVASVARQERFRRKQQDYYPTSTAATPTSTPFHFGIGLDYVVQQQQQQDDFGASSSIHNAPSPLVLDPSARTPLPFVQQQQQSTCSSYSAPPKSGGGMMNSLLRGMGVSGGGGAASQLQYHQQATTPTASSTYSPPRQHHMTSSSSSCSKQSTSSHIPPHEEEQQSPQPPTATELARRAPQAGFLQKMGRNIATYKRRFFVLQPSTQLYYFVSPHDTMPRGCINVDEARMERLQDLGDGRSRLALHWPDGSSIQLEARSAEVADAWCRSLQQERLPYVRAQMEESQQQYAQAQCEIDDLKRQVEHYRHVEEDRDGALEDARRWKGQFEELDEALRLLSNHVRKFPAAQQQQAEPSSLTRPCDKDEEGKEATIKEAIINDAREDHVDGTKAADDEAKTAEAVASAVPEGGEVKEEAPLSSTPETKDAPSSDLENEEKKEAQDQDDIQLITDKGKKDTNISRDISLLDDDAFAEATAVLLFHNKNIMEDLDAPGQHFPSLVNACQQLRENLRLASEEATTAVEDTKEAHARAESLQTRMTKAEKQLCQLWEENCSIRKTLKQKKRERRVLVREVRSLMEQQQEQQQLARDAELQQRNGISKLRSPRGAEGAKGEDDTANGMGSDEERLIDELEEHVVSSIRLHEAYLSSPMGDKGHQKAPSGSTVTTAASTKSGSGHRSTAIASGISTAVAQKPISSNPAVASLFDGSSSDSDSESDDGEMDIRAQLGTLVQSKPSALCPSIPAPRKPQSGIGMRNLVYADVDARSISSVAASFGTGSNSSVGRSLGNSPLRPNPILQLDQEEEEQTTKEHPNGEDKGFKPISVAQRGNATSSLVCPLADVVQTKPHIMMQSNKQRSFDDGKVHQEDLQIYHVTFYTRKIGLQFQKVPAPPTRPRGLLTDAMTADLAGDARGSSKTAAELKRVAAISTWAKTSDDAPNADACLQVATPIDAVLICGFEGFDDSGNNIRPKLGARLVAFDGVSVEVGKWTFDSIRKAIQARGRPLTLSFRNDFLTTDQRAIMTKVVSQMEKEQPHATTGGLSGHSSAYFPPAGSEIEYARHEGEIRAPSAVPSLGSAPSHETAHFVNETTLKTANTIHVSEDDHQKRLEFEEDDLTVSTTGYYSDHHNNQQQRRFTASSNGSYGSGKPLGAYSYRSFSEAGSSASALSSAIGPLMSNLMSKVSAEKKRVNMAPDYLSRRQSVENAPQHHDFQSNLL